VNLSYQAVLLGVTSALNERVAPMLEDQYAAQTLRVAGVLATITANGMDNAVALRVAENASLRALFGDATHITDGDLSTRLAEASTSSDTGLRISELDVENGRLRRLLVELQSLVEVRGDAPSRDLDERIWALLKDSEDVRKPIG
jgi:hypothetical protein